MDFPESLPAIPFPLTHKSLQLAACVGSNDSDVRVDVGETARVSTDGDWGSMSTLIPLPDSQAPVSVNFELSRSVLRTLLSLLSDDAKCIHHEGILHIVQDLKHLQFRATALSARDVEDVDKEGSVCTSASLRTALDLTLAFAKKARRNDQISSVFIEGDRMFINNIRLGATIVVMHRETLPAVALPIANARRFRRSAAFMASTVKISNIGSHLSVRDPETRLKLVVSNEKAPPVARLMQQIPDVFAEVPARELRISSSFHNLLLSNRSDQERATLRFSQEAGREEIRVRGVHQFAPGRVSKETLPCTPVNTGWSVEVDLDGLQGLHLMDETTTVKIGRTSAGLLYIGQHTEACDAHTFLMPINRPQ